MPSRNSNNSSWYVLRYAEDFESRSPSPSEPVPPELGAGVFYDDARFVLELEPRAPERETRPLSGLAVDATSEIYRVDPGSQRLVVERCDGSVEPLVCEPNVLADPRGLALDRRGLLLVADSAAARVVVLSPEDGVVRAVLNGGQLVRPVDVAVAPSGKVFVADQGRPDSAEGGQIAIYTGGVRRAGVFTPRNVEGQPAVPRPVAVMVDDDGTVLVADANHPRLLRFEADGTPLADIDLVHVARRVRQEMDIDLGALREAYGDRLPRFVAGSCCPPRPDRDIGEALAAVHLALRVLRLDVGRSFVRTGVSLSRVYDGGRPGTTWHKVTLEADVPPGACVVIETATADAVVSLGVATADWRASSRDGTPIPFTSDRNEALVQSPPGRFLRLRVTLRSDGSATPSVGAIRVFYPRVSYLDLLPRAYRRDPESALFLEHFLALFERIFTGIEDRYDLFFRQLDIDAAPRDIIDWLACLVDLSFDPSWPTEKRRSLVREAMDLYRRRGTIAGLVRYIEIYTSVRPLVLEAYLERPDQPGYLGVPGNILGCSFALRGASASDAPDEVMSREYAHRFTLILYLDDPCMAEVALPVVERITEVNKPAHTSFTLRTVYPDAQVGVQSTVGTDFVLGGREAVSTRLGGCIEPGAPGIAASVLGRDSVLGDRRAPYTRPTGRTLGS